MQGNLHLLRSWRVSEELKSLRGCQSIARFEGWNRGVFTRKRAWLLPGASGSTGEAVEAKWPTTRPFSMGTGWTSAHPKSLTVMVAGWLVNWDGWMGEGWEGGLTTYFWWRGNLKFLFNPSAVDSVWFVYTVFTITLYGNCSAQDAPLSVVFLTACDHRPEPCTIKLKIYPLLSSCPKFS